MQQIFDHIVEIVEMVFHIAGNLVGTTEHFEPKI